MDEHKLNDQTVLRRQVYYLSGFDPRGARFYQQLYRDEAKKQALVNGIQLDVGSRKTVGEHAVMWSVKSQQNDQTTTTDYTFLEWDDLIRAHWRLSRLHLLVLCALFYVRYIGSGAMQKLWRSSKRYTASVLAPLAFAMLSMAFMAVMSWVTVRLVGNGFQNAGLVCLWATAATTTLATGVLVVFWAERLRLLWLARVWIFVDRWSLGRDVDIQSRWRAFAQHIADDTHARDADEILLVGHSIGSMAAVSVLSELLHQSQQGHLDQYRQVVDKLRLLTLGQTTPMLSFFPGAAMFREQLRHVAASSVPWLDVSSPFDPLCVALTDPTTGSEQSGVAHVPASMPRVCVRSARFDRMFDTVTYKKLAKDAFRIHFQYIMATEQPVENDYFSFTAGPHSLIRWMERRS